MIQFPVGKDSNQHSILFTLAMANRHGLIAGATGTGKTVTLQYLAEQFAELGICVFSADIKGDLSGMAFPSQDNPKLKTRITDLKITNYTPHGNSVVFWDLYGKSGHPLRATISEMGPLLLGRLLNLNDTQQGVLNATFSAADDEGLLLIDLKDLQSMLQWMSQNSKKLSSKYGNIPSSSVGAIQRGLLTLKEAGADDFFGEPNFKIETLLQKDSMGKGVINILDATKLISDSRLYSVFLLWLLSTLYETLPEVGDIDKPKLVFFFDEAHLLFQSAPKVLLEKIEQMVRLIRSKGVGVYFITQTPLDIPETVLGQLSNRVQHALRAFTPKDQKAVKTAAETFRPNPALNTAQTILELGVGEALVSFLDSSGSPARVEKVKIFPPSSQIGAISEMQRQQIITRSNYYGVYEKRIDKESAYEMLEKRNKVEETPLQPKVENQAPKRSPGRPKDSITISVLKSTARSIGTQAGRQIIRGILGSIFKK